MMEYRKLGNTDLTISAIAYGAWAIGGWMWGGADDNDAITAINKAVEMGATTIDTAPVYGMGHSEVLVGKAIREKRDKVQLCTKYGLKWDKKEKGTFYFNTQDNQGNPIKLFKYAGKQSVIDECEKSLKRLNTDYIDLYQIHWPDITTPIAETMEAVEKLMQQGKIRYAGVCNYDAQQLDEACKTILVASNQVPYSMVNRGIENDVVTFCTENNVGILAYSPLQRGLLTGKITEDYKFNDGDNRIGNSYFSVSNIKTVNEFLLKMKPLTEKYKCTLSQLVLNWTVHQPGITCALAGARNASQVEDNVGALNFDLSADEWSFMNVELSKVQLDV